MVPLFKLTVALAVLTGLSAASTPTVLELAVMLTSAPLIVALFAVIEVVPVEVAVRVTSPAL